MVIAVKKRRRLAKVVFITGVPGVIGHPKIPVGKPKVRHCGAGHDAQGVSRPVKTSVSGYCQ